MCNLICVAVFWHQQQVYWYIYQLHKCTERFAVTFNCIVAEETYLYNRAKEYNGNSRDWELFLSHTRRDFSENCRERLQGNGQTVKVLVRMQEYHSKMTKKIDAKDILYTLNTSKNVRLDLRRVGNKVMDASIVTPEFGFLPTSASFDRKISDESCWWESLLLLLAQKRQNEAHRYCS